MLTLSCGLVSFITAAESRPAEPELLLPTVNTDVPQHTVSLGDLTFLDDEEWVEAVSGRRMVLSESPQAVTIINLEEDIDLPVWTVPDRLRYEAGIDVYQTRHGQMDVGIRGWNSTGSMRTLVVLDGRSIDLEELGQVFWISHIHPSDITRIEVVKGPSSVRFGANAFGGVVAIRDRDVGDIHEVHTMSMVGTDGLLDIDATALGPIGSHWNHPAYYKVSIGGSYRDDQDGTHGRDPILPTHEDSLQTGDDDLDSMRLSAVFGIHLADEWRLEADAYLVDIQEWDFIEDLSIGSNWIDIEDNKAGLRLYMPFGELRWLHNDVDTEYSNQKSDPNIASRRTRVGLRNNTDELSLHFNHSFDEHVISAGVEYSQWNSLSNFWAQNGSYADASTWVRERVFNRAAFLEDQFFLSEEIILNAGVRFDNHSIVGKNTSPRLSANYRVDDTQFFRLSWSQGYRLPSHLEVLIAEDYFTTANDLEAETINSFDVGWQKTWRHTKATLGAFYSRAQDIMALVPLDAAVMQGNLPNGPFFEYRNIDNPITVYGVEAELRYAWAQQAGESWFNMTYQDFSYDHDFIYHSDGVFIGQPNKLFDFDFNLGEEHNAPPQWKINLGTRYQQNGWFTSGVVRYVDKQSFFSFASSNFQGNPVGPDVTRAGSSERSAYAACDLSVGYNWGVEESLKQFVRLSALNIFDQGHYEGHKVPSSVLAAENEAHRSSEVGREVTLTFGWEW